MLVACSYPRGGNKDREVYREVLAGNI